MVIENRIFNSKLSIKSVLIFIFTIFFISIDLMLNRLVLSVNLHELEKLGLEKSTKFKNVNIYFFNKTKSNEILTEKAAANNFKLMKRLMEPPFGNWIHEPLGRFFLNKLSNSFPYQRDKKISRC